MNLSEQTLSALLRNSDLHIYPLTEKNPDSLTPVQMAHLYIKSALLSTFMEYIKEQLWLKNREDKVLGEDTPYIDFISPFFENYLAPIFFLKDFLIDSGPKKIKKITKDAKAIEARVLSLILESPSREQKDFAVQSLQEMTEHFLQEEKRQEGSSQDLGHNGPCLYTTFDNFDGIFNLDYRLDKNMVIDNTVKERLYQGAGVGVQSGYSTILLALHNLGLTPGNKVIDLGSGYGRVGLVFSLLQPDTSFIGYEYVPHRVEASNNTCEFLDLQDNLSFKVQDLSLESFELPDADVYYLYDPFTDGTYRKVLEQIFEVSRRKKITIVTKGNARDWVLDAANENEWPEPVSIDEGNLCIFRSSAIKQVLI